jgi:hypothetical protein
MKKIAILSLLIALSGCGNAGSDQAISSPINPPSAVNNPSVILAVTNFEPSASSGITSNPRIGDIYFMNQGGRPGHGGLFKIRMDPLPAGDQYVLSALIYGDIASASYEMKSLTGSVLASSALLASDSKYTFANQGIFPSEPFFLEITAIGINGQTVTSANYAQYNTAGSSTKITPDLALLTAGKPTGVTVEVASKTISGTYTVSLVLPAGFQSDAGPWTTTLAPGMQKEFRAGIIAPAGQAPFSNFTIRAVTKAQSGTQDEQYSQVRVVVQ